MATEYPGYLAERCLDWTNTINYTEMNDECIRCTVLHLCCCADLSHGDLGSIALSA